jgi:molybdenum cofactor synthesis domain-containing protein
VGEFDLLEKTELRIEHISLQGANLTDVAAAVAEVLGLPRDEVLVTDALDDVVTIDILRKSVDAYGLVGKQGRLLDRLSGLPGVGISEETSICSEGMLGWIALDEVEATEALQRSEQMAAEIRQRIAKRAIVFSTGFEVSSGQIEDTNTPTISARLEAEGFSVTRGPTLEDDHVYIAGQLRQAIESGGFGVVITTGGVGAEAKDHTIEAVMSLDPEAATPYISKFEKGTGRHAKDGVRIGVGEVAGALIVALPGPNDEVKVSLEILLAGLASNVDKHDLAEQIAKRLRDILRAKMAHSGH